MQDDLKDLLELWRRENATAHAETRNYFAVVAERLESRFEALAESVAVLDEKLDRKTTAIEERVERGFAEVHGLLTFSHQGLDRRMPSVEKDVEGLQPRVQRLESRS